MTKPARKLQVLQLNRASPAAPNEAMQIRIGRSPAIRTGTAGQIRRTAEYVEVLDANGCADRFEDVVIGAHADQARKILSDADPIETSLLGAFSYSKNRAVLHRDRAWMPKRQRLWSAWNYINAEDRDTVQVTYWMTITNGPFHATGSPIG